MKRCNRCSETKPFSEFYTSKKTTGKISQSTYCKSCIRKNIADWRKLNPNRYKEWREANRDRYVGVPRKDLIRMKQLIVEEYGGRCACCGEDNVNFLTIDHINGGGAAHRKQISGGDRGGKWMYRWLQQNGFPKDNFQLLCYNCNCAKRTRKECPHKLAISDYSLFEISYPSRMEYITEACNL